MKIFKNSHLLILLITSLSILAFIACSSDDEDMNTNNNVRVSEITFEEPISKTTLSKNSEKSNELTIDGYLDFVFFDGIPAKDFMKENNIDSNSFKDLIKNKSKRFKPNRKGLTTYSTNNFVTYARDDELSLEEIRDAMINECENGYCCGLDDACAIAVKIAYHFKKATE